MTIIVQRSYSVAPGRQQEFERLAAAQRWPALHEHGVPMLAFGGWTLGGSRDELSAHFAYTDFAHLEDVQPGGVLDSDVSGDIGGTSGTGGTDDGTSDGAASSAPDPIASNAPARVIELAGGLGSVVVPGAAAQTPGAPPPPTFGRGSVVSERTYAAASQAQFLHLSQGLFWPWLEERGARMIGFGHDPFGTSEQLITLFAFRSLAEWYRLSRPSPKLNPTPEMVEGWQRRSALTQHHWGRLLTVATDYGQAV